MAKSDIDSFDFKAGRILARKYEVVTRLGAGWEGEVYLVRECTTGIERAAKFFFPQRNPKNRNLLFYAKKLHKLRQCPILIHYHTQDIISFKNQPISFLISDYVEGELLSEFLSNQPGKRLDTFQALHLLHALAKGIENIHYLGEYHGDLHTENVMVRRYGLGFDCKLLDMYMLGAPKKANIHDDVVDLIRLFYDIVGGKKHYAKLPIQAKYICNGLKRTLILKKFRSAGQLREHLELLDWE
ncbi:serine/threonine protein kinase domain protein [hydrothermal vent metagenome]|uniref:Serine/threonine protein kinase domain protein n=1 Tax=hydrothermal vent metagenome TaxID=652676 RepID=A0A3B1AL75_9ZZZZ